jgi:hypothetical protein
MSHELHVLVHSQLSAHAREMWFPRVVREAERLVHLGVGVSDRSKTCYVVLALRGNA